MITFTLENGCTITLRTSGTEPKIKYYSELGGETREGAERELEEVMVRFIEDVVGVERWGLKRRGE